jgi:hypothetical protein
MVLACGGDFRLAVGTCPTLQRRHDSIVTGGLILWAGGVGTHEPTSGSNPLVTKRLNRTTCLKLSIVSPSPDPSSERPLPTTTTSRCDTSGSVSSCRRAYVTPPAASASPLPASASRHLRGSASASVERGVVVCCGDYSHHQVCGLRAQPTCTADSKRVKQTRRRHTSQRTAPGVDC